MNKNFFPSGSFCWIAVLVGLLSMASCKKYNSLGFDPGTGAPTISSVLTWSKTDTTAKYDTIVSYDAAGNKVTTLKLRPDAVNAFDSLTTAGNLGSYYFISGANLGSTTNITFNGYAAYFNRALITDQSIIVQVPAKTPYFGSQATDSLVITTMHGQASYKFVILPPPPTVESYSNYNFSSGSEIELTGVGFAGVTSVVLTDEAGATADVSIVSQTDAIMVLQFPVTDITRGNLEFTYDAGGTQKTITDDAHELVDLDNAYRIFTDSYQNDWGDGSWSGAAGISTDVFKTGATSFKGFFPAGGWKIEGFANWWPSKEYDASYKYLSFWVRGGSVSHTLNIQTNTSSAGYGQNAANPITVPPGVWTYFKIPLGSIDFWTPGSTLKQFGFFLRGQNGDVDESYYFDDVILIK